MNKENSNFFLIVEENPNPASFNMATDEALLNYVCKNKGLTILRFYRWGEPTLSIGYSQKASEVANLDFLSEAKIALVRRITGGKAVLHEDEVTYSFSTSDPFFVGNKTVLESFYLISSALIEGLKIMGIPANLSSKKWENLYKTNLPCFSYPTGNEILVNGKKLIGSAQKRLNDALLQHGSIPITMNKEKLAKATFTPIQVLENSIATIKEVSGETDIFKIVNALKSGFIKFFNCSFQPFDLSEISKELEKLRIEKYSNPLWNIGKTKGVRS